MKIIFSGGGTLGPVMPLLALYQELAVRHPDWQFLWVGTRRGAENAVLKKLKLARYSLPVAKWRRPWDWRNLTDFLKLALAAAQSLVIIWRFKPDLLISAGGFVSLPLHLAAALMRKTTLIHQQDASVGLANKIMAPFSSYITTALAKNLTDFPKGRAIWLGNPIRRAIFGGAKEAAREIFKLEESLPVVLVLGGGTGALSLNRLLAEGVKQIIADCQVIHVVGIGKEVRVEEGNSPTVNHLIEKHYHQVDFLDAEQLAAAYAVADLVVTRAGFSALSELAVLGKPVILAPLPGHQEENARYFSERTGAPIFLHGRDDPQRLIKLIKKLLLDHTERLMIGHKMQQVMPAAALDKMTLLVEEISKQKQSR